MKKFIHTDKSQKVREKVLSQLKQKDRKTYLSNQLIEMNLDMEELAELYETIVNEFAVVKVTKEFQIFNSFVLNTPENENQWGTLGLYLIKDALLSIENIIKSIEEDNLNIEGELSNIYSLSIYYENEPVISEEGINSEDGHTDYGYYEEINSLIANTEDRIERLDSSRVVLVEMKVGQKYIIKYYETIKKIIVKISNFYNDTQYIMNIVYNNNTPVFADILSIPVLISVSNKAKRIRLTSLLEYEPSTHTFYNNQQDTYCISGGILYDQRAKFMDTLCTKTTLVTYEEFRISLGKSKNQEVQTIYKNIRDGLRARFRLDNPSSAFCINTTRIGYTLKRL